MQRVFRENASYDFLETICANRWKTAAGLGSAAPYKKGAFGGDTTETYFGEALAVIRPDGTMPLTLTVSDESRTVTAVIPVQA